MLVRQKPFGEWVVAYYDSGKTDPERLLERLRTNGCKKAQRKPPVSGRLGDVEISILNPVVAPGDFFHIEVKLPEGVSADVTLAAPDGWTVPDGAERNLKAGVSRYDVQLPRDANKGTQTISFTRDQQTLELKVDVVNRVRD